MNEFYLTIKVRVVPSKELQMRSFLQDNVNKQLRSWNDGRYPYAAEQVFDGIERLVKRAAYDAAVFTAESAGNKKPHTAATEAINGLTIHVDAEELNTIDPDEL
jgi:hypothetical protein